MFLFVSFFSSIECISLYHVVYKVDPIWYVIFSLLVHYIIDLDISKWNGHGTRVEWSSQAIFAKTVPKILVHCIID
jgi:hypothetical protein